MRLLLDEMHSPTVAQALHERGHEVNAVASDPLLRGMTDAKLLHHAAQFDTAVVTENIGDFARLDSQWAATGIPHTGIIYTNPNRFTRNTNTYPANLTAALAHFLENPPIDGNSWVWWLQPPPQPLRDP